MRSLSLALLLTIGLFLFGCGASEETVPEREVEAAVLSYYGKHPVKALHIPSDYGPREAVAQMQQVKRYEVKNSYSRTIDGEKFYFCDVAVETQASQGSSLLTGEMLPLKFVKRGNSWYSSLNTETEIQQLPKESLSKDARSVK